MSMETWKPRRFVEEFQKRAGLLIDGKPGPQTQMALWLIPEPPMGGHWYQPVETTKADPLIPTASTTVHVPPTFADTPTPIDPADIRPGDVVELRQRIDVTRVDGARIYEGPWAYTAIDGDNEGRATWHLVSRPDPDAEAVEALAHNVLEIDDPDAYDLKNVALALAALREQGWDVVRRAES